VNEGREKRRSAAALRRFELVPTSREWAFVELRELLPCSRELSKKLAQLESKFLHHDAQFKMVFDAIRQLMSSGVPNEQRKIKGLSGR
jgi:hypothetical protein